jgi:enoyl-[acyl-carrier-protein] reductase (NADH)
MVTSGGLPDELREIRSKANLLQREGTGWDVGKGVLFLCSDLASWVTGVILSVDGGSMAGTLGATTPQGAFR